MYAVPAVSLILSAKMHFYSIIVRIADISQFTPATASFFKMQNRLNGCFYPK